MIVSNAAGEASPPTWVTCIPVLPAQYASQIRSAASASVSIPWNSWPARIEGSLDKKRALLEVAGSSFKELILRRRAVGLRSPEPIRFESSLSRWVCDLPKALIRFFFRLVYFSASGGLIWKPLDLLGRFYVQCANDIIVFCLVLCNVFCTKLGRRPGEPHLGCCGPELCHFNGHSVELAARLQGL